MSASGTQAKPLPVVEIEIAEGTEPMGDDVFGVIADFLLSLVEGDDQADGRKTQKR